MPVGQYTFRERFEVNFWKLQRRLRTHFGDAGMQVNPTIHTVEKHTTPALVISSEPHHGALATIHLEELVSEGDAKGVTAGVIYTFQQKHLEKSLLQGISSAIRKSSKLL